MHETLNMLLPLAGILLGAKAAAQLSHRFGLPAVFGELLLGLVLGPSLLGWLAPNETLQLLERTKASSRAPVTVSGLGTLQRRLIDRRLARLGDEVVGLLALRPIWWR